MSDEDLELLVTMDDPGEEQHEDTFNHLQAERYASVLARSDVFGIVPAGPAG